MHEMKIHLVAYEESIWPWLQEHLFTPFWRYYWNPMPGGIIKCDAGSIDLTPESILIVPGYYPFSTRAERPFSQYYIHFNFPEGVHCTESRIFRIPLREEWALRWREWSALPSGTEHAFRRDTIAASLLAAAVLELPPELLQSVPDSDARIARAKAILQKRLADPPDNAELAATLGFARQSFVRLFRDETGETPQHYCRRIRIEHACRLLGYTGQSIDEIAELCGFADRYHFSRVFNSLMRCPPAAFRHSFPARKIPVPACKKSPEEV